MSKPRKPKAGRATLDRPVVSAHVATTQYPNAVVIKIELLGGDVDARERVRRAIIMAVDSLQSLTGANK